MPLRNAFHACSSLLLRLDGQLEITHGPVLLVRKKRSKRRKVLPGKPPLRGSSTRADLLAPRRLVLQQDTEGAVEPLGRLVAVEGGKQLGPGQPLLSGRSQDSQDLVGQRVAEGIAENVADGRLAVIPQGERG